MFAVGPNVIALWVAVAVAAMPAVLKADAPELGFRSDLSKDASVEEAAHAVFYAIPRGVPAFGMRAGPVWLRAQPFATLGRGEDIFLEIGYPQLDSVTVFYRRAGAWHAVRMGDQEPPASGQIQSNYFLTKIPRDSDEAVFIRAQSTGPLLIPVEVYSSATLPERLMARNVRFGIYFGFLLIVTLFNVAMFGVVRERVFGYYALYTGSLLISTLFLEGYAHQFIAHPELKNSGFVFWGTVSYGWATLFAGAYLDLAKRSILLRLLQLLALTLLLWSLSWPLLPYPVFQRVAQLLVFTAVLALFTTGAKGALAGSRPAVLFLSAWLVLMVATAALILSFSGIVRNMLLAKYSVYLGSSAEVALIMIGLADRFRHILREKERQQQQAYFRQEALASAYARFVPPQLLEILGKSDITQVRLGDVVRREMTVLFSDIRGFTSISESMTPEESFRFINAMLKRIGPVIREHGGFIDKYIGDGIMALFANDPENAVRAAIRMRQLLSVYNRQRAELDLGPIGIGVGIHTGDLMLGTIGETQRMEGTVIADAVNLASRMEGMTKAYGATILISEQTLFRMADPSVFRFRLLDCVRVRGKREPVALVEILDGDAQEQLERKLATRGDFERGAGAYRDGNFRLAVALLRSVTEANPSDVAATVLCSRAEGFLAHGTPSSWSGIQENNTT